MKLIKPSIKFLNITENPLQAIELAGRTCCKSENMTTEDSAKKFVQMLLNKGHHAMIEHASASYKVICDRGVTHEIVRHRLFSYAQESTRYCNYGKGNIQFIIPCWLYDDITTLEIVESSTSLEYYIDNLKGYNTATLNWIHAMGCAEIKYQVAIENLKWTPQQARSVLPNSLKTEIVITGNLREWRHFFKMRCSSKAHPQMQEVADMLLNDMSNRIPILFDEYNSKE